MPERPAYNMLSFYVRFLFVCFSAKMHKNATNGKKSRIYSSIVDFSTIIAVIIRYYITDKLKTYQYEKSVF